MFVTRKTYDRAMADAAAAEAAVRALLKQAEAVIAAQEAELTNVRRALVTERNASAELRGALMAAKHAEVR